jgi:hypothetical protein
MRAHTRALGLYIIICCFTIEASSVLIARRVEARQGHHGSLRTSLRRRRYLIEEHVHVRHRHAISLARGDE